MQTKLSEQTGFAQLSDLPCLKLQCDKASAIVSLYGGQVVSYQPTAGSELLWFSEKATWQHGAAIRGGVPVCWPWFGPVDRKINPEQRPLPNHGLVRTRLWQLKKHAVTEHTVSVTLEITVNDLPELLWPAPTEQKPVTLSMVVTLTPSQLHLQLVCDMPFYQQAALHSYFKINSLQHTLVSGLSQHYFDQVSREWHQHEAGITHFNAEIDRIYDNTGAQLTLLDDKQQRIIDQQGHDASVIWNPWQQKSRNLQDMTDDGFTEFVCVETARLSTSAPSGLCLSQTLHAP
jgi:glucose-6-phosphate 1-epimerase